MTEDEGDGHDGEVEGTRDGRARRVVWPWRGDVATGLSSKRAHDGGYRTGMFKPLPALRLRTFSSLRRTPSLTCRTRRALRPRHTSDAPYRRLPACSYHNALVRAYSARIPLPTPPAPSRLP